MPLRMVLALVAMALSAATMVDGEASAADGVVSVRLHPAPGTELVLDDRSYGGVIELTLHPDGVAVVEELSLDGYLAGIAEVPLSWPMETLRAQTVAARTYLMWTLDRGRSADGGTYDFDICATTACQVYAGTGVAKAADGDRWLDAIAATSGEILIHEGAPAQTLYSSSAGGRTRAVQDVFGGDAKPYLQPVDSPEAGVTPFEAWDVTIEVEALRRILAVAGYRVGADVRLVAVDRPTEGDGESVLVIESDLGRISIPVTTVRSRISDIGPLLYPGLLPAARPGGGRLPQAIPSYTFDVAFEPGSPRTFPAQLPPEDLPAPGRITFVGEGWGHGVGMSQWGAYAMGESGTAYGDILAHYYGGLRPVGGGDSLPDTVRVGLAWGLDAADLTATGVFELRADGVPVGEYGEGDWSFLPDGGGLTVMPPPDSGTLVRLLLSRLWPR